MPQQDDPRLGGLGATHCLDAAGRITVQASAAVSASIRVRTNKHCMLMYTPTAGKRGQGQQQGPSAQGQERSRNGRAGHRSTHTTGV